MKTFKDLKPGDKIFYLRKDGYFLILEITDIKYGEPYSDNPDYALFIGDPIIGNYKQVGTFKLDRSKNENGLFADKDLFIEEIRYLLNEDI